ncbi:hypothetical protein FRB90_001961 [Tulasnella sp. 427]|nr:hypothetical protein FRB90_001961 [Tulasnella sp. 427]
MKTSVQVLGPRSTAFGLQALSRGEADPSNSTHVATLGTLLLSPTPTTLSKMLHTSGWLLHTLGGRLVSYGGDCKSSQSSTRASKATAMIATMILARLVGNHTQVREPGTQSVRDTFLRLDFVAQMMLVLLMTYGRVLDFSCATDIWMFQMLLEFGCALLLDWAHIKTAIGNTQGSGHVRRRRRGGGEEIDLHEHNEIMADADADDWELL